MIDLSRAASFLAVILGVVNLVWLYVQWRRGATTQRIAIEAHQWAGERRDAERAAADLKRRRQEFYAEVKRQFDANPSKAFVDIPDGTDPEWLAEGEALRHFRVAKGTMDGPALLLARWSPGS